MSILSFRRAVSVLLFLFAFECADLTAQSSPTDSVRFAFLPALSFDSDLGFITGGLANRYHYRENQPPFVTFTEAAFVISTKGLASGFVSIDKPNAWGSKFRVSAEVYGSRFLQDNFFGIGNYEVVDEPPSGQPDFYNFQSFSVGGQIGARYPFYQAVTGIRRFDATFGLRVDYETPWDNGTGRILVEEQPTGFTGGTSSLLTGGFLWEGRDSEFRPQYGTYTEVSAGIGGAATGSSFQMFLLEADMRGYTSFHFIRTITFANRLLFSHTSGDVPYWQLGSLGGSESLRGYTVNRFMDDNAILLNTELRTWLFKVPSINAEYGGNIFFDIGRSFPNGESLPDIYNDLKYTFGIGGTSSYFTPDFVLRVDVGFSDEGTGFYLTAGYAF
ncbi:MAG: BamA/TamA family outer membrane protein [Bacteroidota bacterium]